MTERNKTIDEIIEIVQNMEWGVMTNDIDGKELLKKLNALKNIVVQADVMRSVCKHDFTEPCFNRSDEFMYYLCSKCGEQQTDA